MTTLAIIPARGGSKRLPGKNLAALGGAPLIAWTITAARDAGLSRVIVSTDDPAISAISREWGADVPFMRPSDLAGDTVSTLAVVRHTLDMLQAIEGVRPEVVTILPPSAPFRSGDHIRASVQMLRTSGVASVVGIGECGAQHPYRMCRVGADECLVDLLPVEGRSTRTQTFPEIYWRNASLYTNDVAVFAELPEDADRCFHPESTRGLLMDRVSSIDITDATDLLIAEAMLQAGLVSAIRPTTAVPGSTSGAQA